MDQEVGGWVVDTFDRDKVDGLFDVGIAVDEVVAREGE